MAKKFPLHPKHPERICWGCDKYCPATDIQCGNGSGRTQHPAEMLGDDWYTYGDWGLETATEADKPTTDPSRPQPLISDRCKETSPTATNPHAPVHLRLGRHGLGAGVMIR